MLRRNQIKILWTVIIILTIIQLASIFLFYQNNYGEALTINNIEDVAEKATSSVVFIRAGEKTGSGVIVTSDGYIITNYHVVDDTDNITVRLHNKNIYVAENVGVDKSTDIAVLKINVNNLDFLELADSDNAKVGSEVVAIGNPFGLDFTVTSGIISAVHRDRGPTVYRDFIQTDASINPGNSGGPLLDLNSKVIGINTFIISEENAGELGFAIPSNLVKKIFLILTNDGKINRGYIGVIVEDIIKFDDKGNGVFIEGSLVKGFDDNGPALGAGLKQGDLIIAIDNKIITTSNELRNHVAWISPGTDINITIKRNETTMIIPLKLGLRP